MTTTAELELAEPPATPEQRRRESDAPLHAGTDPPLAPAEIARWIAPQIAERIERAAWWPEHTLRENWKLGYYSAYMDAFPAPSFRLLQVRFVSEPDATALLEVSAGNDEVRFRRLAPDAMRAALAATGFRPGGARFGYVKPVLVESREDCEVLAAEIAGLVTGCLSYTGRDPIQHMHAYKARTRPAHVYTALTLGDVGRLLCSSVLVAFLRAVTSTRALVLAPFPPRMGKDTQAQAAFEPNV